MIVTLDGPAGAGKSTAARALARRLGFHFLDTGAMYRAVAWAALQRGLPWSDEAAVADFARQLVMRFDGERVFVGGCDVSQEIRTGAVTAAIHFVADNPRVREHLVALQRAEAAGRNIVTEGRDQGTVAFPQAECKIFLTASAEERARRRCQELRLRAPGVELEEVLRDIRQRDARDEARPVGRLAKAPDAVEVVTDRLTLDEVVDELERTVRRRFASS